MIKNSIKELTEGMQRLCAVANRIVAHEDELAAIERDLLLEELRRLYDVAMRMETGSQEPSGSAQWAAVSGLQSVAAAPVEPIVAEPASQPEPEPEPEPEPVLEQEPVFEPAPAPEPVSVVQPEPESAVLPAPEPQPRMEELENNGNGLLFDEVVIEPEPTPEPTPEPESTPAPEPMAVVGSQASLLDYLKHPASEQPTTRTLGDTLGQQAPASGQWSAVGNQHKVSDLRTVININDKFSFMSELFHNNMKAYNDFILRLNAIDNRDEALLCVNEVAAQQRWDESSMTVKNFYTVFDKKF